MHHGHRCEAAATTFSCAVFAISSLPKKAPFTVSRIESQTSFRFSETIIENMPKIHSADILHKNKEKIAFF
jgi:hypothetical protein